MKKLLITGATGFLGRNFIQCIEKEKYEIFILGTACPESVDNDHFYICDWTGFDADRINEVLNRIQAEVLVMCAWDVSTQSYWNAFENHMWADVSIQLAQMFLHTGGGYKQIMFFGTSASYDYGKGWLREEMEYEHPSSLYGLTKLYASQMISKLVKEYGGCYCEARIFSVYGRYERATRLVPLTIQRLCQGEKVLIDRGGLVRDYLYAEDVAEAIYLCLVKQAEGVYNICSGNPVTIHQIILKIADILKARDLVEFCDSSKIESEEFHLIVGDNTKLRGMGFQQKYNLENGIKKTLEWLMIKGRIKNDV